MKWSFVRSKGITSAVATVIGLWLALAVSVPVWGLNAEPTGPDERGIEAKGPATEVGRDVYYKVEGIVTGSAAPATADTSTDYPRYNFESRVLIWFANQQHLYYGSFVLAVPIFCMIIEFMGMITKDKALAQRYDRLA